MKRAFIVLDDLSKLPCDSDRLLEIRPSDPVKRREFIGKCGSCYVFASCSCNDPNKPAGRCYVSKLDVEYVAVN